MMFHAGRVLGERRNQISKPSYDCPVMLSLVKFKKMMLLLMYRVFLCIPTSYVRKLSISLTTFSKHDDLKKKMSVIHTKG